MGSTCGLSETNGRIPVIQGIPPAVTGGQNVVREREILLWWGVLGKFDTLLDVALETLDAGLEELLLLVGDTIKNVDGLLDTVGL